MRGRTQRAFGLLVAVAITDRTIEEIKTEAQARADRESGDPEILDAAQEAPTFPHSRE